MKCVILNDIFNFFLNRKRFVILYFLCLILVCLFFRFYLYDYSIDISETILGISFSNDVDLIVKLIFIFNFFTYIYLSYYIFLKDIDNDYGNIFSRICKGKWIFSKFISILVITILYKTISYCIIYLLFHHVFLIDTYLNNLLFVFMYQIFSIFIYILCNRYKIFAVLVAILLIFLLTNINILTSNCYRFLTLVILVIITLILCLNFFKKNLKFILERNDSSWK
jgi:hypothetical protein